MISDAALFAYLDELKDKLSLPEEVMDHEFFRYYALIWYIAEEDHQDDLIITSKARRPEVHVTIAVEQNSPFKAAADDLSLILLNDTIEYGKLSRLMSSNFSDLMTIDMKMLDSDYHRHHNLFTKILIQKINDLLRTVYMQGVPFNEAIINNLNIKKENSAFWMSIRSKQEKAILDIYKDFFPGIDAVTAYMAMGQKEDSWIRYWLWGATISSGFDLAKSFKENKNDSEGQVSYNLDNFFAEPSLAPAKKLILTANEEDLVDSNIIRTRTHRRMQAFLMFCTVQEIFCSKSVLDAVDAGLPLIPEVRKFFCSAPRRFIDLIMTPYKTIDGDIEYQLNSESTPSKSGGFIGHGSRGPFKISSEQNTLHQNLAGLDNSHADKFLNSTLSAADGFAHFMTLNPDVKNWGDSPTENFFEKIRTICDKFCRTSQVKYFHKNEYLLLLSPKHYVGNEFTTEFTDAFNSALRDLIKPFLMAAFEGRIKESGQEVIDRHVLDRYHGMFGRSQIDLKIIMSQLFKYDQKSQTIFTEKSLARRFIQTLSSALIGPRLSKSLNEAVVIWHRRVATLEAIRAERRLAILKENGLDTNIGWVSFCEPWYSPNGEYRIVPLISAEALVEEGEYMDHCVGGYYEECRRGHTHILSLQSIHGERFATIELLTKFTQRSVPGSNKTEVSININIGQFKGYRNDRIYDPELHDTLKRFVRDVRTGEHKIDIKQLYVFSKLEKPDLIKGQEGPDPDLAAKLYPLYRSLLPKLTPETFDEWIETTGLKSVFEDVADALLLEESPAILDKPKLPKISYSNAM